LGFVGFGVLGNSKQPLFEAKGLVGKHLGKFIAQMQEAGSTVEIYVRPPLPAPVWKPYVKGEDYEHMETEAPLPPPDGPGLKKSGPESLLGLSSEAQLWPEGRRRLRQESQEVLCGGLRGCPS